jgi:hypothetical protein
MHVKALVLYVLAALSPQAPRVAEPAVVSAIVTAGQELCQVDEDACRLPIALLTLYAWKESEAKEHPRPQSWDAKAGVSCGPWQMRCAMTSHMTLTAQARWWLHELRSSGLAGLDSSKSRAERRTGEAMAILQTPGD